MVGLRGAAKARAPPHEDFLVPAVYAGRVKILYGIVGEGMGHAIRSRVVLEHLLAEGHEVEIMASGRAVTFLEQRFGSVNQIHGLFMISEDNRVKRGKTLWANILAGAAGAPRNIAAYFELVDDFEPEVVISDFESWTYLYAKTHNKPVFSIDNMQIINRCTHDDAITAGERLNFEATRAFVKGKLPLCDHYFITSFFRPPIRKPDTSLYPPILRREILDAARSDGDHLLVYQTAEGHDELAATLAATGVECRIYGMRRGIEAEQVEGYLRYRPFSESVFIDDLRTARAVIAGGGFTLLGEAVYLHKPILSVPLHNQFEQTLNARYVAREGYGVAAENAADPAVIASFLTEVPRYRDALSHYHQDGNTLLLAAVDEHLDRAAAGLLG
jgi:uncharacterized protein (TIGR00661 family)